MQDQNRAIGIFNSPEEFLTLYEQYKEHRIKGEDIVKIYDQYFCLYKDYLNLHIIVASYQDFIKDYSEYDYSVLQQKVINKINNEQEKHFTFFNLFSCIISHLLDQSQLKIIIYQQEFYDNFKDIKELLAYSNHYTSVKFVYDNNFNFYISKRYSGDLNSKLIEHEIEIYQTNFTNDYQSFIVHTKYEKIKNDYNYYKIMIPFYPICGLSSSFHNKYTLSLSDKFVMIKEIANGMSQLHDHQIYNIDLNETSIYIDKNKDSYIGNFILDTKYEGYTSMRTKSFYYHHPDLIQPINTINDENKEEEEEYDEKCIKYDLYSFGVLIYAVFSNKSPGSLMHGIRSPFQKIEILGGNYKDFLFSFIDFEKDLDMKRIKKIIDKCMSSNQSILYSNFKEVIEDIDLIHKLDLIISNLQPKMKEEIEYRINNATDSNTYECTLSDIIESYYKGNHELSNLIKDIIQEMYYVFLDNENVTPNTKQDFDSQTLYILKKNCE